LDTFFKKGKLKSEKGTDESISTEDYYDLLAVLSGTDSSEKIGKTQRNMYKPWIKDLIRLKAYTGRRNAEIFLMKWNMIHFEGETPIYIVSPNLKINRLLNQVNPGELDLAYIPIIDELETFLNEKGLTSKRNADEYIIAPQSKSRVLIEKQASKSLTFFCEKLNRAYKIQMKSLRSTYVTSEEIYAYRQGQKIQQHTNFRITNKH
jgi:integrase